MWEIISLLWSGSSLAVAPGSRHKRKVNSDCLCHLMESKFTPSVFFGKEFLLLEIEWNEMRGKGGLELRISLNAMHSNHSDVSSSMFNAIHVQGIMTNNKLGWNDLVTYYFLWHRNNGKMCLNPDSHIRQRNIFRESKTFCKTTSREQNNLPN